MCILLLDAMMFVCNCRSIFQRGLSNAAGLAHRKGAEEFSEVEHPFGRPAVLLRLGQFILTAKRNLSRKEGGWVGSALLPLVLLSERQDGQSFLVVGISPLNGGVLAPLQDHVRLTIEQPSARTTVLNIFSTCYLAPGCQQG